MSLQHQIEAAIRSAGGDFSQAATTVCQLVERELPAEWADEVEDTAEWLDTLVD